MNTELKSFAELVKLGKQARDREKQNQVKEITPLLGDLFKSVVEAKEQKKIETIRAEKKERLVDDVEELKNKLESSTELVEEKIAEVQTETEKKLSAMVTKLQNDIANLQLQISNMIIPTGGTGEVRILRMDDVIRRVPEDGATLVWNSVLRKFELKVLNTGTTEEDMPYAKRVDFITDDLMYKGEATPGSTEADTVWRISQVTIGVDGDVTEKWAEGNANFDKAWDQRVIYNYS